MQLTSVDTLRDSTLPARTSISLSRSWHRSWRASPTRPASQSEAPPLERSQILRSVTCKSFACRGSCALKSHFPGVAQTCILSVMIASGCVSLHTLITRVRHVDVAHSFQKRNVCMHICRHSAAFCCSMGGNDYCILLRSRQGISTTETGLPETIPLKLDDS